jgi:hypothetical protein
MTIFPLALAQCNHIYIKRTNDAICLRCRIVISLQAYERWLRDKERAKEQKKNQPKYL